MKRDYPGTLIFAIDDNTKLIQEANKRFEEFLVDDNYHLGLFNLKNDKSVDRISYTGPEKLVLKYGKRDLGLIHTQLGPYIDIKSQDYRTVSTPHKEGKTYKIVIYGFKNGCDKDYLLRFHIKGGVYTDLVDNPVTKYVSIHTSKSLNCDQKTYKELSDLLVKGINTELQGFAKARAVKVNLVGTELQPSDEAADDAYFTDADKHVGIEVEFGAEPAQERLQHHNRQYIANVVGLGYFKEGFLVKETQQPEYPVGYGLDMKRAQYYMSAEFISLENTADSSPFNPGVSTLKGLDDIDPKSFYDTFAIRYTNFDGEHQRNNLQTVICVKKDAPDSLFTNLGNLF